MEGQGQYFRHIDGLRAVAVLGVLLAHYGIPGVPGGFLGVDVFFVISGYLITRLIIQEKGRTGAFSYRRFYVRRFRRLLPAALFLISFCIVLFYPILGVADLSSFLKSIPLSILSLANIGFFREVGYFDTAAEFKPLLHMWSLSVEEQFYLIWPTVLLVLLWLRRSGVVIMAGLFVVGVLVAQITVNKDPSAAYFLLPSRAFELLAGALLASYLAPLSPYYRERARSDRVKGALALLGLAMIVLSFVLMTEESRLPGLLSLVPVLGTVLVVAYGANGMVGRFLSLRPVVWVGLISYSLYLFHWPVQVYFTYRLPDDPSLWLRLAFIPISVGLAAVSYYLIEERFRQPAPREKRFGNTPFLVSTTSVGAVIAVVAYVVFLSTPPGALLPEGSRVTNVQTTELPYPGESAKHVLVRFEPTDRPATLRILLLGDSHAHHLQTGFIEEIVSRGAVVDLAQLPACPPLFGVSRYFNGGGERKVREKDCLNNIPVKQALALQPEYDVIVLSARWYSMLEKRSGRRSSNDGLTDRARDKAPKLRQTRRLFESSLETTVSTLLGAGKRVVIFSQVPSLGADLSQCQNLFPGSDTSNSRSRCYSLTAEQMRKRAAYTDGVFSEYDKSEGVLVVLPMNMFCDADKCHYVDSETGVDLYRDNNHLSEFGSLKLVRWAIEEKGLLEFLNLTASEKGGAVIN